MTIRRYVERNALMAKAVERAEDWRWGSLWGRRRGDKESKALLSDWPLTGGQSVKGWPVERPRNWLKLVNQPMTAQETEAIRTCLARNRPYGSESWELKTASRLGLMHTLRPKGRPSKERSGAGAGYN